MTRPGEIRYSAPDAAGIARLALVHEGKQNAITVAMWQALRGAVETLQAQVDAGDDAAPRAVIVHGDGGHFAAGADIGEFPAFRFEEARLRRYHEEVIAPALAAMRACDVPLVARIDGSCLGGGLEIAAGCDIRIAAPDARFGVPIAKLGFPMAPDELLAVARIVGTATLRELLLEARLLDAPTALARGLVHRLADDAAAEAEATAARIAVLPAYAARANKRLLRQAERGTIDADTRRTAFDYADHPEHAARVHAFLSPER